MPRLDVHVPHRLPVWTDGPDTAFPLLLINSIGMTAAQWDGMIPALTAGHRVVRYNQRGHSGADVLPAPYTIADLGTDAVRLLDELGIERASICGLSLGGMVGMWVAVEHPERVDRLSVVCTTAHPGNPVKWSGRAALARSDGMPTVIEQSSRGWFTDEFVAAHPHTVARVRNSVEATPVEGYAGCCAALEAVDLRPELHRIAAPTLVVAGAQDRGFPPEHAALVRDGIPGAGLVVLEGVAHIAPIEAPDLLARTLLGHLDAATYPTGAPQ